EQLEVVSDVSDHRDVALLEHVDEPEREARAADTAGEQHCSHAATSASVSTSAARFGRSTGRSPSASNRAALPGPYSGSNPAGSVSARAFVVPSSAATSAGAAEASAARSAAVARGRSALTTSTGKSRASSIPATTAAPC